MLTDNNKIFHRKKILVIFFFCAGMLVLLCGRLVYLCVWQADHYSQRATDLHERERSIKAARGRILDRNGKVLADNKTVCTVSVVHLLRRSGQQGLGLYGRRQSGHYRLGGNLRRIS